MDPTTGGRVVLFGGRGFFGARLARELRASGVEVATAGREHGDLKADLRDPMAVAAALDGAGAAVCAAGPFQTLPDVLFKTCLARKIPYLDLADDRGYVGRLRRMLDSREDPPPVCSAWSTVSALTALLTCVASAGFNRVQSVRSHMAPGNRPPRGAGTLQSFLSGLGRPMELRGEGGSRAAWGWSEPASFPFPAPIGARVGYLVDSTDHTLLPELFGGAVAEFRVSSELGVLNAAASRGAALVRARLLRDARSLSALSRGTLALFGGMGHEHGAVGVEVRGLRGGRPYVRRASIVSEADAASLAILPAAVMIPRLLGGREKGGWMRHDAWLDGPGLEAECVKRGYKLHVA